MGSKTTDWRPGPTVCRCCLSEGCYKDISTEYFWMGKREVYAEMLSETFSLSIAYSQSGGPNSNSRLICEPCISRLRDASDFRKQVQECEKTFMQYLDPGTSVAELEVTVEPVDTQVKVERVKLEKAVSDDDFDDRTDFREDDDDDDDLDDQPLTKLASKVPKKESVDILDLLDNAKVGEKRKSSSKAKTPVTKKSKTKKEAKATSSKAPKPEKKKKGDASTSGVRGNVVNLKTSEERRKEISRNSAVALIHSTNACPFKYCRLYMCFYCSGQFIKMPELINHTASEHGSLTEDDIRRAIVKLGKRQPIKINLADFVCTLCNDELVNFEDLKNHLLCKHKKDIDSKNDGVIPYRILDSEYSCILCSKKFEKYRQLNSHINGHYTNFVCDQCGTGFASEHRLRAHAMSHQSGKFPCEKCDRVFNKITSKRSHIRSFHMKEKINKCMFCLESFREYYQKQKHLLTVHGLEKKHKCKFCSKAFVSSNILRVHEKAYHLKSTTYICDVCNYKTFRKAALTLHMVCHTDEMNYKCEVCKKAYARKKTLTEHMKIHNNDRRFVCPYCDKAFIQKCSLKGHLKTHHKDVSNLHC